MSASSPVSSRNDAFKDTPLGAADVAFGEMCDLADDAGDLADAQVANGAQRAPVLVAERQMVEQVLDRGDAELLELLRAARPDAAQELRRLRQCLQMLGDTARGALIGRHRVYRFSRKRALRDAARRRRLLRANGWLINFNKHFRSP